MDDDELNKARKEFEDIVKVARYYARNPMPLDKTLRQLFSYAAQDQEKADALADTLMERIDTGEWTLEELIPMLAVATKIW